MIFGSKWLRISLKKEGNEFVKVGGGFCMFLRKPGEKELYLSSFVERYWFENV
jgi:hypothetical protein